jgi:hypothetical protein
MRGLERLSKQPRKALCIVRHLPSVRESKDTQTQSRGKALSTVILDIVQVV